MEASTTSKDKISKVIARASDKQSASALAQAFVLTVLGRGEEAAKLIKVRSEAQEADGTFVMAVDEVQEVAMHVR